MDTSLCGEWQCDELKTVGAFSEFAFSEFGDAQHDRIGNFLINCL